ncbi:beta-ketoacyl-ACP synthase [Aquibium carbonis]|uniref:Beta-ketoacyl-ACP synthase n=1 Tax=Aquibium carbonis TaxID=2495581 RepID=A0A3S0AKK5_9HYPH|nr:beta-ketoacyl-ACP synthase [Aquibium carbonis]RST81535.1 beta-ketoacyl-ACP synthase [Aquibium carbonis]
MNQHDAIITGIGIVSSLGEGPDAHLSALTAQHPRPVLDVERFAPYTVHPLPEIDWSSQIAKRGDLRQMEAWQRLGTYAAGLALDDAGLKGHDDLSATMDMIVAAGGGERDVAVDGAILEYSLKRNDRDVLINEKLTTELRPTLFLAQLSNLLAGNISIVHKVTGSSRTFMGEEGAGVSAIATAVARIHAGQSSHLLVGAAFNTEHPDHLLGFEVGGALHRDAWAPIWSRAGMQGGGLVSGSGAAFLVIESRAHAAARDRKGYAAVGKVASGRARRSREDLTVAIGAMIDTVGGRGVPVISGASGAHRATEAEKSALESRGLDAVRGFATLTGHLKEAQFPFAMALAAIAVRHGAALAPFDETFDTPVQVTDGVLVTTIGSRRFEGAALVSAA